VRGYENLMMDFADEPPELGRLIQMVLDNNMKLVDKWLEIGVDVMGFGDDLGTQTATMMSPEHFRKYLKPGYARTFGACRVAGAHVRLHTDGHVLEIVDDLIDCGVTILNPQVRCNTLEGRVARPGRNAGRTGFFRIPLPLCDERRCAGQYGLDGWRSGRGH